MNALTTHPETRTSGQTWRSQAPWHHRALVCTALTFLIVSGLGALPADAQIISLPADAETYSVTDLGTLDGGWSVAQAINNSGQVVGYASSSTGAQHAFLVS